MKIKHTNEKNRKLSKVDSLWKQCYIIPLDLPKKGNHYNFSRGKFVEP